jgi:hypothetical protein
LEEKFSLFNTLATLPGDGDDVYVAKINESAGDIIQDTKGNDTIQLLTATGTEVTISLTQPTLGTIGISKQDDSLIIDIDANGIIDPELDLTIAGYFNQLDTKNGFIEQVANFSGDDILSFLPPSKDSDGENSSDKLGSTVYRFFNPTLGVHFYTADKNERDYVRDNLNNYNYEGESYVTVDPVTGNSPEEVYRFFNSTTGVHLYTTNGNERDYIIDNLDNFAYEDVKFYAYETEVEGTVPIHRFYEPIIGVHFYTPNEVEKTYVENNLSNYTYESIAYYAFPISDV